MLFATSDRLRLSTASTRVLAELEDAVPRVHRRPGRRRARVSDRVLGRGALPAPDLGDRGAAARRAASRTRRTLRAPGRGLPRRAQADLRDQRSRAPRSRSWPGGRGCAAACARAARAGWPPARRTHGSMRERRVYFAETGWVEAPVAPVRGDADGRASRAPRSSNRSFTTVVVDPGAVAAPDRGRRPLDHGLRHGCR